MPALAFSKWSSGGNTTLFLHVADGTPAQLSALAQRALCQAWLGAEQAGCVSLEQRSLQMAGGEFCVNACRALGALLAHARLTHPGGGADDATMAVSPRAASARVRVSGWPGAVVVDARPRPALRGAAPIPAQAPAWEVSARLRLEPCAPAPARPQAAGSPVGGTAPCLLVRLPGITHLLLPPDAPGLPPCDRPETDAALARRLDDAAALITAYGLEGEAAAGVIWWRMNADGAQMFPVVRVRDAGTLMAESACGSGALALALELERRTGRHDVCLRQPSASSLHVRLGAPDADGSREALVDGPVRLLASGTLWLEDDDADG